MDEYASVPGHIPAAHVESNRPFRARPLTTMSDTDTRAESHRTEDEAVTLPIPTCGLLTTPLQGSCNNTSPAWLPSATTAPESNFSITPLLGRGATGRVFSPRRQAAVFQSTDGPVLSYNPRPWPTLRNSVREFGLMPSRACSSGGFPSTSRPHSSCGTMTMAGCMAEEASVDEKCDEALADPTCSDCSERQEEGYAKHTRKGELVWRPETEAGEHPSPENVCSLAQVLRLPDACCEAPCSSTYQHLTSLVDVDADILGDHPLEPSDSSFLHDGGAAADSGMGDDSTFGQDTGYGDGCYEASDARAGDGCESPAWLTAEDGSVSDAITQLQAVVSGLSEPYQRYIRERALELTRIIDENLQRQGLEPVATGVGSGMGTPSKKAATAAAALVLAVAASGTRWPYSTTSSGADGSGEIATGSSRDFLGSGLVDNSMRGLFGSSQLVGAQGSLASDVSLPFSRPSASGGPNPAALAHTMSYGTVASSESCTMCFGSVLGNSQARQTESANQTSGAVSARAATASHHAHSSARPTPRSTRSYSSFYARQQSHRRLVNLRANGGVELASAISSACSNAYRGSLQNSHQQQQQHGASAPSSGTRRMPPRPPPRGLGCGLGLAQPPRKTTSSDCTLPEPSLDIHNLPYMAMPYLEPATSLGTAREHYHAGFSAREHYQSGASAREHYAHAASAREYYNYGASLRRSRASGQQSDQQQLHDQEDALELGHLDPAGQRYAIGGCPISGSASFLQPVSGQPGKYAPNSGRIRPATVAPAGYQPPWQRPLPSARSGSDRQRTADHSAEVEQKNRKAAQRGAANKASVGVPPQPTASAHRRGARKPPSVQTFRTGSEFEDDVVAYSAREPVISDATSSYQQLLRRSVGARASMNSLGRRPGAPLGSTAVVPSLPPSYAHGRSSTRCMSYPIITSTELPASNAAAELQSQAHTSESRTTVGIAAAAGQDVDPPLAPRTRAPCAAEDDDFESAVAAALHGNGTWDSVLQSDLPYHLVRAFPAPETDRGRDDRPHADSGRGNEEEEEELLEPRQLDWQPLHTVLTLDELQARARQPGSSDAPPYHQHYLPRRASNIAGGSRAFLPTFDFDTNADEEPATAFAIINRCATRDRSAEDQALSSMAATSSLGDLSSLLPAPAWRPARAGAEAATGGGGRPVSSTFAVLPGQRPLLTQAVESTASTCSVQAWDKPAAPDLVSRMPHPMALAGTASGLQDQTSGNATATVSEIPRVSDVGPGGSAAAQLRSVLASMGGMQPARSSSAQSRRWQLETARLVVPDKEQMWIGSPARPRYAGNSDSHASATAERLNHQQQQQQQQLRRREGTAGAKDGASARTPKTSRATAGAGVGNCRQKTAGGKRASAGAVGAGRVAAGRSRSTPHRRVGKALRATAKGQPTANRPPQVPLPRTSLFLPQSHPRPTTPVMPNSPPPPQQSQTPVQLQLHTHAAAPTLGARRWIMADDAVERSHNTTLMSSSEASEENPSTPTRRRVHIHSPEDMPLSAAARQSTQPPRLPTALEAAANRSGFDGPAIAKVPSHNVGLGVAMQPGSGGGGTWGGATYGIMGAQGHRLRPSPGAISPSHPRGLSYAPPPAQRWVPGRTYTTTSVHTDGTTTTTTVVTSPGLCRGAWQQDCTPNILSPPRNYDRAWVTPTRKTNTLASARDMEALEQHQHQPFLERLGSLGGRGGDLQDDGDAPGLGSPPSIAMDCGRRSLSARPDLGTGQPHIRVSGQHRGMEPLEMHGLAAQEADDGTPYEGSRAGTAADSAACRPSTDIRTDRDERGHNNGALAGRGVTPGFGPKTVPGCGHTVVAAAPLLSAQGYSVGCERKFLGPGNIAISTTYSGSGATGAEVYTGQALQHRPQDNEKTQPSPPVGPVAAAYSTTASGTDGPGHGASAVDAAPTPVAGPGLHSDVITGSTISQTRPAPGMKAEAVQTDAFDATMDNGRYVSMARCVRRSCEDSRRVSSPTGIITSSRTDGGGRGYNNLSGGRSGGRPPTGAFRPSGGFRAAPAGTGGAQLALLHQAAWAGLCDPRVIDALMTLEAGIAVLDPVPAPPPSSIGTQDLGEGGSGHGGSGGGSVPNGCFGLFIRSSVAATPKVPMVSVQELMGQRPVLLRVHVADGAVELVLLRPRRGIVTTGSHQGAAAQQPGHPSVAAAGEQRVRVAALSGLHPPLTNGGSSAFDDLADPSSRWVQLVAMDGGLMRLSACSPADHARLVLGLNAGLLAAMGAIGEETSLSVVPLCRGLGGMP